MSSGSPKGISEGMPAGISPWISEVFSNRTPGGFSDTYKFRISEEIPKGIS